MAEQQPESSSNDNFESAHPDDVRQLFFQMDNMLHNRVNSSLVAQSIFFAAIAAAWSEKVVVVSLCVLGFFVTLLFTFTNLKLYWRVTWLIGKMKQRSKFYCDYLAMKDIDQCSPPWGWFTARLMKRVTPAAPGKTQSRFLDTGWLYTWGLLTLSTAGFAALAVIRLCTTPSSVAGVH